MKKYVIFFLIATLFLGCSKHGPVDPDTTGLDRSAEEFENSQLRIFGDDGTYYDADISEILQGPGLSSGDWGQLWEDPQSGYTWAVAVALEEVEAITNTRRIRYRFLANDGTASAISPLFYARHEIGDGGIGAIIEGNISLPRVAACYFYTDESGNPLTTYVEVAIIYQIKEEPDDPWDIRIVRTGFDPDDIQFPANNWNVQPEWIEEIDLPPNWATLNEGDGDGMLMADIAYDPRSGNWPTQSFFGKGDLYFVWTWFHQTTPEAPAGPRVYFSKLVRTDDTPYNLFPIDPVLIQKVRGEYIDKINHGYQPRIDIGLWGFPGEIEKWTVSVIFCGDDFTLFPHFAYWPAGSISGLPANIVDLRLSWFFEDPEAEEPVYAGFMPSIDVGLPGSNLCALTWTQVRTNGYFFNDTTVSYLDTYLGFGSFSTDTEEEVMKSWSSPSVCVMPYESEYIKYSYISYLQSDNPNSLRWRPMARVARTIVTQPLGERLYFYNENELLNGELGLHFGDYDFGSQYSNWYGMSSSCVLGDNYWVLWSSPSNDGDAGHLTSVYGIWGYPTW